MRRKPISALASGLLLLCGCGGRQALSPPPGESLPVAPASAARPPTVAEMLTPSQVARPERVDEPILRSQEREDDRFDLPPS